MKASQRDFARVAQTIGSRLRVAFLCGPDEAGAAAAAKRLVAQLPDAGERVDMEGAALKADPARLGDETRSNSLFGGSRHIWVRASGDDAHDAVQVLLELIDSGEGDGACPVIIVASNATDKSRTAKLVLNRDDSLMAMFYQPDLASVTNDVRTMAHAAGLKLGAQLAERIARGSSLDVRLAQSEVTKLALYLDASPQSPKQADSDALDAIGASTEEDGFNPLINAVLGGNAQKLPGELRRMRELELNPVAVLLAMERRAAQLAGLTARLATSSGIGALLESEQKARRVFWRDKDDLALQMQRWDARKLDRLVHRLADLHRRLLTNSQAAELLLAQELTEITRFAAPRRT